MREVKEMDVGPEEKELVCVLVSPQIQNSIQELAAMVPASWSIRLMEDNAWPKTKSTPILVIATPDDGPMLHDANWRAMSIGNPVIMAQVGSRSSTLGPFVLPGRSACWECWRIAQTRNSLSPELSASLSEFEEMRSAFPTIDLGRVVLAARMCLDAFFEDAFEKALVGEILIFENGELAPQTRPVFESVACNSCRSTWMGQALR